MRIARNCGYGYPTIGGHSDVVTNQRSVYHVKIDHGTAGHTEKSGESYAMMQRKHKAFIFTMDPAANRNILPWRFRTGGLKRTTGNGGCSSEVRISAKRHLLRKSAILKTPSSTKKRNQQSASRRISFQPEPNDKKSAEEKIKDEVKNMSSVRYSLRQRKESTHVSSGDPYKRTYIYSVKELNCIQHG
jgi:hypothetical protein